MAIKKTNLAASVRRTAEIIEEHLGNLSPTEGKPMLKDIHKLAVKSFGSRRSRKNFTISAKRRSSSLIRRFGKTCINSRLSDI